MAGSPGEGGAVTAITGAGRTLGATVNSFLSQPHHRPHFPLTGVTDEEVARVAGELWGPLAARTWNRHAATVQPCSFAWRARRRCPAISSAS